MEPVVRRLLLKRFRSVANECVELDNPTILIGRNGAGKSNLVDAFSFLADAMSLPLQAVFDKRGGISVVRNRTSGRGYPPNLGLRVDLGRLNGSVAGASYAFEVKAIPEHGFEVVRERCLVQFEDKSIHELDRQRERFVSTVQGLNPALDPSALCLPLVGGDERFAPVLRTLSSMRVYAIEPRNLKEMQDPESGTSLKADGSNAASVLQDIGKRSRDDLERICEVLNAVVPDTKHVRIQKHGKKLALEFVQQWAEKDSLRFDAFNMSDGTLRALGILTAIYQSPTPALIVIEEPEQTIHIGALTVLIDLIRQASRRMQVVVTTHSPDFLDAEWIEDRHLRILDWSHGVTRALRISEASRKAIAEHLMGAGELLRANALEPQPAPLFDEFAFRQTELFGDLQ